MLWWYLYSNPYYLLGTVFVGIAMIFSLYAQTKVRNAYTKYRMVRNHLNMTGAQVAREILDANGMRDVPVQMVSGELTDHFDPRKGTVNLSADIYQGTSISSMAIAAHECGHAIQWHKNWGPIKFRDRLAPLCSVSNTLGWVAIMIGLIMGHTRIAWIGFFLMLGILLFQLVTLPVEFDASKRGLEILEGHYLYADETDQARYVLSGAALTYVAATFATIASLLRIFLLINSSNRD